MEMLYVFGMSGLVGAVVMAMAVMVPTAAVAFLKRSHWAGKNLEDPSVPIFVVASGLAILASLVTFVYSLFR